eukprot:gene11713-biopygen19523
MSPYCAASAGACADSTTATFTFAAGDRFRIREVGKSVIGLSSITWRDCFCLDPTKSPTHAPTTKAPTKGPTDSPTTKSPTDSPTTKLPTAAPSVLWSSVSPLALGWLANSLAPRLAPCWLASQLAPWSELWWSALWWSANPSAQP